MAHLVANAFSMYQLTDKERLQGIVLSIMQKQVIQNRLAEIAEEKLLLEFDPDKSSSFIQQEAYKRGQIDILTYLLADSEAAEESDITDLSSEPNP